MSTPQGDWLTQQLYEPYTADKPPNIEPAEKDDKAITAVGHNLNEIYLGFVFTILVFSLTLIIFNGFIYEKFFKESRDTEEEYIAKGNTAEQYADYRKGLEDELRYHPTMYWGSSMIAIAAVTVAIVIALLWWWFNRINPVLIRENLIGRDIAVAMRVGDSVKNTSDLLAAYVHPLEGDTEKRKNLSGNLNQALGNALRVEQNVTRTKYLPTQASQGYNYSAIAALPQRTNKSLDEINAANEALGRAKMARAGLRGSPLGPATFTPEQISQLNQLNELGRASTTITPGGKKTS